MIGEDGMLDKGRCTLHIRNNGTNRVRARESVRSRLADQISRLGKEQMYLPAKSPRLKTRK